MKKVININLGGIPYIIDEDAYEYLQSYLESLREHFKYSDGCEDILYDIELRISELFQESLKTRKIISMTDLNEVINIMGKPEDFGAEPIDEHGHSYRKGDDTYKYIKTGKRMYRDTENKVVGGVCAGLSSYLVFSDPVWVRLAFALLFFVGGVGFITYLVLWMAIPAAVTSADKLSMKGEPINIENIAKTVEDEISDLSKRITEMGRDIKL